MKLKGKVNTGMDKRESG